MYICSYGSNRVGVLICLRRVILSLMLPYSFLQLSICSAYAERKSLFLMYRMCSRKLDFKLQLFCPTYRVYNQCISSYGKVFPVHEMKVYEGSGCVSPRVFNLRIRCM